MQLIHRITPKLSGGTTYALHRPESVYVFTLDCSTQPLHFVIVVLPLLVYVE